MSLFYSALLGILQGLTEFLPVSSSGHLVFVQNLIPSFKQPGILFDVFLHFGTIFAVIFYFRKSIFSLITKYWLFLIIGTLPAVVVGFLFKKPIESLFQNVRVVGYALIFTGLINYLTYKAANLNKAVDLKKSLLVGIAQAVAIIPGVSRSGSTIFAGVKLGINPKEAAEFSFLLSIPAILGANLLEIFSNYRESVNVSSYLTGFIFALVSGVIAISLVLKLLKENKFNIFSYYCLGLGLLILLL